MFTYIEFQESLKTMKQRNKDHNHFTNYCLCCKKYKEDSKIIPVYITRNEYIELDYSCIDCFNKVKVD